MVHKMVKKVKTLKELKIPESIKTIIEYLLRKKLEDLRQETRSGAEQLLIHTPWNKDQVVFNLEETIDNITKFLGGNDGQTKNN